MSEINNTPEAAAEQKPEMPVEEKPETPVEGKKGKKDKKKENRTVGQEILSWVLTILVAVVAAACPAFVPLIESGRFDPDDAALAAAVEEYLTPIRKAGATSLILGCTHYGLIEAAIRRFLGDGVRLIEAADCAARELADWLRREELCGGSGEERFCTSGSAEDFARLSAVFLGRAPRGAVEHVPEMEV